jgi:hypothetical protein
VAHAWMPGAKCIRAETDGGPLKGGAPRAVWLTLGTRRRVVSVQSAAERLNAEGRSCHIVWDPMTGGIAQLIPILRAGRAIGAPEQLEWLGGTVHERPSRVNSEGRICAQIGVLADSAEPFTSGPMTGLAAILAWLDSWHVPRQWPAGRPMLGGQTTARSRALWARGGYFGVSQVPECESVGPGAVDTDRLTGAHVVPISAAHGTASQHAVAVAMALSAAAG